MFNHLATAAEHNTTILSQYNFDLDKMFAATTINTSMQYGSEFRPTSDLEPLLSNHPLWQKTKQILEQGVTVPLTPISATDEAADNAAGLARGNHKGPTA